MQQMHGNIMSSENYSQIHDQFIRREKEIRSGPVETRTCQDICCLIVFMVLVGGFVGIGIYYLVVAHSALNPDILKAKYFSQPVRVIKQLVTKYWPIMLGMFGLGLVLSLLFVCLIRHCTKCMVYTLILAAVLIMGGIIAISAVSLAWGTMIAASVGLLLFLCVICCFCKQIERGIVMLKAGMQFLKSRPTTYLIPLYTLLMALCFLVFWIVTLICMQKQASINIANGQTNTKEVVFYIFWLIMIVFMALFLYYVMVFIVAYTCANWYYGNQLQGCCRGIGLLNRAHIGSVTFASLFIVVVKLIQLMGAAAYRDSKANGNCCISICFCCFSCCLAQIQYMVEVLNKYSAIAMALTGEGYISSAKTALAVLFRDFPLFYVTNGMADLIRIGGVIFTAGIPTLLSFLLVQLIYPQNVTSYSYQITIFILLIFLVCMALSYYFIFLITIAQACVFFFFCLDRRYRDIGVTIANTPLVLKQVEKNPKFQNEHPNEYIPGSAERIK